MKKFACLCLSVFLFGCGEKPTVADVKYMPYGKYDNPTDAVRAEKQVALLADACPALFETAAKDIQTATASFQEAYPYQTDEYGWKEQLEVTVKLKNDLKRIPAGYKAWGHTLSFYVGTGAKSGVITDKQKTQMICGWEVSKSGENMFHSIKGL